VGALVIVVLKILGQASPQFATGLVIPQIDILIFERSAPADRPEPLDENVI